MINSIFKKENIRRTKDDDFYWLGFNCLSKYQ